MLLKFPPRPSIFARSQGLREGDGFASFFLGGFECSSKLRIDGRRLDLLEATGHARLCENDYRALLAHGIRAARDGFRWHLIEAKRGAYDWSSAVPMVKAARATGIEIIWDLCHYGWPQWLDIWSPQFVDAFADYAAAAARLIAETNGPGGFYCVINEISFWAWAGGDVEKFAPAGVGRGAELKRQLAHAAIAATRAIKAIDPTARFICAEPLIQVTSPSGSSDDVATAEKSRLAQFEALDMLLGITRLELGGGADVIDIIGLNYYPDNQWYHAGGFIPLGHHAYRPLRSLLAEVAARYGMPIFIAETGAEGSARSSWLHYVSAEVEAARRDGAPVEGICIYPIIDYPGWYDDRHCEVGLLTLPDAAGARAADIDFAAELKLQRARLRA